MTQIKIIDFDLMHFINFEAQVNAPVDEGVVQIEHLGMHIDVNGSIMYGVRVEVIVAGAERSDPPGDPRPHGG